MQRTQNLKLARMVQRSLYITKDIGHLVFFQVLKTQRKNVDHQANVGFDMEEGTLVSNGGDTISKEIP
jgi:hypothetical protein